MMEKNNLIKGLLALLCIVRIFMPAVIKADDEHKGEVVVTIVTETVHVDADKEDVIKTDIGDIEVENNPESESGSGYALDVSASDGYTAKVETGVVTLNNDFKSEGNYYAVNIDVMDGGKADVSTEDVNLKGISMKGETVAAGVRIDVDSMFEGGSSAKVSTGDIILENSTPKPDEAGLKADALAGFSGNKTASAEIETGNITISSGDGINASARMNGSSVDVTSGNIAVEQGNGVKASSMLGQTEVLSKDVEVVNGIGDNAYAIGAASTTIVSEDINVTNGTGIKAEALNNGSVTVTADSVSIKEEGTALEISARNNMEEGSRSIIPQEIIDQLKEKLGRALTEEELEELSSQFNQRGNENVQVIIKGDVKADTGIVLNIGGSGNVDILIDGTLQANTPISLTEGSILSNENFSLTLWKIEQNTRATVDDPASPLINYIVRIEEGEEDIFNVVKANGETLNKSHDYDVANVEDELLLKVNDGYKIVNAYNNNEKLERDAQGRYIINVPYGGGISFSVDYEKEDPQPAPSGGGDSSSDEEEKIVVRFVPPTTGIETPFNRSAMMKKIVIYSMDILIISLFILSINSRRNRDQFAATLPSSLR